MRTTFLPSNLHEANTSAHFGLSKKSGISNEIRAPHSQAAGSVTIEFSNSRTKYPHFLFTNIQRRSNNISSSPVIRGVFSLVYIISSCSLCTASSEPQSTTPTPQPLPIALTLRHEPNIIRDSATNTQSTSASSSDSFRSEDPNPTSFILSRPVQRTSITHHRDIHARLPHTRRSIT